MAAVAVGVECALAVPIWLWIVGAAVVNAIPSPSRSLRVVAVVVALYAVLAGRDHASVPPPNGAVADDVVVDTIVGWVAGPVTVGATWSGFVVDVDGIAVWVTVDGQRQVWPGDRVSVTGRLVAPRGYRDPGSPDRDQVIRDRGARWELHARSLSVIAAADRLSVWRRPARIARRLSRAVAARGGDSVGNALVRATVVGDRSAVPSATDDAWRAAGVYHALSVSGMHLAVVAMVAFWLLVRAIALVPAVAGRISPRRLAAGFALVIAIAYTLVTGGQVATLRALMVVGLLLVGEIVERRARIADALGLAALLLLAQRPSVLFDPSFELSFVAAATLVIAGVGRAPPPARRWARVAASLWSGIRTSWIVTLATAPITALRFGQVSLGGVVGNLLVGPAIELVTIPLGLLGLLLQSVTAVGGLVIDLAIVVAAVTARAIAVVAAWTPTLWVRPPTATELVLCGGLYGAWAWARLAPGRVGAKTLAVIASVGLCGSWWWQLHARTTADQLRVTFLDVGQGDAAVVELPDGQVWLVDAGGAPGSGPVTAQIAPGRAVAAYLRSRGIARIDLAIVSHPHPDHYLGLLAVIAEVPIAEVWIARGPDLDLDDDGPAPGATQVSFSEVVAALQATGTRVVAAPLGSRSFGDVTLDVVEPGYDPGDGLQVATADPVRTVNDNSLVVVIERAGQRVLFCGDIEAEGEDVLIANHDVAATIVKVPHHGSPTSSSDSFVRATHPRWAVMSLGRGNRFGFPSVEVVARWRSVGAQVVRTDRAGAVTATIDRAGTVVLTTFDRPRPETASESRVILPP
jgi:competence protein ComEC